jgi:hypothetical protein
MPDLPKGLITRVIAILVGTLMVATLVSVINLSSDDGGLAVLLYVFAAAIYLAYFLVKHEDEIPPRSDRR